MRRPDIILTYWAGVNIKALINNSPIGIIQTFSTTSSGEISVSFLSFNKSLITNQLLYKNKDPVPTFDISIAWINKRAERPTELIKDVQLTHTDSCHNIQEITLEDILKRDFFRGTYKTFMELD